MLKVSPHEGKSRGNRVERERKRETKRVKERGKVTEDIL